MPGTASSWFYSPPGPGPSAVMGPRPQGPSASGFAAWLIFLAVRFANPPRILIALKQKNVFLYFAHQSFLPILCGHMGNFSVSQRRHCRERFRLQFCHSFLGWSIPPIKRKAQKPKAAVSICCGVVAVVFHTANLNVHHNFILITPPFFPRQVGIYSSVRLLFSAF